MESNTETTTLTVRPARKAFDRGLASLRKLRDTGVIQSFRAQATYDPNTKIWNLTVNSRDWASMVQTWGSTAEALWIYRLEQAR